MEKTNRDSKCLFCRFLEEGKCTVSGGKEICDAHYKKLVEKEARIKWENEFVEPVIRQLKTEAYDLIREKYLYPRPFAASVSYKSPYLIVRINNEDHDVEIKCDIKKYIYAKEDESTRQYNILKKAQTLLFIYIK